MTAPPLDRHFALRKLHSLLGLVPIGAFLCFHLFENSLSVKGGDYFLQHVILTIEEIPYVELMEIFFIGLPILFHGIYGLIIWYRGKSNVSSYGYFRNWMYWVQRITGLITFVFIITHVWGTRIQVLLSKVTKEDLFDHLADSLDNGVLIAWYVIGILAAVIHFSNGLSLFLITWGFTIGRRSQRIAAWGCALLGLLLIVLSAQALRGFINPAEIAEAVAEAAESTP